MARGLILVVEDDSLQRKLYVDALTANGYQAVNAQTGERAISLLAHYVPKLVILDINLPGIGGVEVCRRIRAQLGSAVSVIFFTSSDRLAVLRQGIEAGGDDFLTKGVGVSGMLERVGYWMHARARSLEPAQRDNILKNVTNAIAAAGPAQAAMNALPPSHDWRQLDPQTDENVATLQRFVGEARTLAPGAFGRIVDQKLYLLGYITGAVNHLANSSLVLKIRFLDYLKSTLRGSEILEDNEIERLIDNWHELYGQSTFEAACHRGEADFQSWNASLLPPAGLQEFASASQPEA
ncbi:MAG: response regulator [Proteobacteria bacterium]|nr:response regulator [Pseudomonadota bacterium]MBI3497000.1 response regulator [Pseudomonadota bacterium]